MLSPLPFNTALEGLYRTIREVKEMAGYKL
jgi:hypothetical protein